MTKNIFRANQKVLIGFVSVLVIALIAYGSFRAGEKTANTEAASQLTSSEQPFANAPATPIWTKTASFGAWDIKCREMTKASSQKLCVAALEVVDTKSHQTLLAWIIGFDDAGKPVSTIHTLSGVQIARGIEVELGNAPVRHLAYTACMPNGCDATTSMDDVFLEDARKTEEARISIYSTEDKVLNFKISSNGLDQAIKALKP